MNLLSTPPLGIITPELISYLRSVPKKEKMITIICPCCLISFDRKRQDLLRKFAPSQIAKGIKQYFVCSHACSVKIHTLAISKPCSTCGKIICRELKELRKNKSGNIFCNRSCAAIYHNIHKTYGSRRSKLELWICDQIKLDFPNLIIINNNPSIIGYELDIFLPDISLAIEINGIFHFKPIYGQDKLDRTQKMDKLKIEECLRRNIELFILLPSKRFIDRIAQQDYLPIKNLIASKL